MADQTSPASHTAPKMTVVIVDWDKVSKVKEIINDTCLHSAFIINGIGTAKSEILDVLGVGSVEKAIVINILPGFHITETIRVLNYKMEFDKPGRGIAFTIPLSGIAQPISKLLSEEKIDGYINALEPDKREQALEFVKKARENQILSEGKRILEGMRSNMENELEKQQSQGAGFKYDMVLAVINKGYSDDLMDAAKEAGAKGGTVIQARRTGREDAVKFFGITLQAEKEIVAILTERENKKAIMKAINHSCGISSEAAGIVLSVPVDTVAGLSTVVPDR